MQDASAHAGLAKFGGNFRRQDNNFGVTYCSLAKSGDYVGSPGSSRGDGDPGASAYSREPIGGISGTLLVAHPDDGGNLPARLPEGEIVNSRQTKYVGHPSLREALEDGLGEGGGGRRHSASVSHLRVVSSRDLPIPEPSQFCRNRCHL
ncbi:unannotated protein [freshwater metagenome]|uniref:Unannotated protein n=1 Tax=freshwater metagenome TaxID=449393 RepID=A0A6J6NXM0_9ZZZZ